MSSLIIRQLDTPRCCMHAKVHPIIVYCYLPRISNKKNSKQMSSLIIRQLDTTRCCMHARYIHTDCFLHRINDNQNSEQILTLIICQLFPNPNLSSAFARSKQQIPQLSYKIQPSLLKYFQMKTCLGNNISRFRAFHFDYNVTECAVIERKQEKGWAWLTNEVQPYYK